MSDRVYTLVDGKCDEREIATLERVKTHLDNCWEKGEPCLHPDTGAVVSNDEYDRLVQRLAALKPTSPGVTKPSSADYDDPDAKKFVHRPPMTSISKAIGPLEERKATLKKWLSDTTTELGYDPAAVSKKYVQAYKLDGVAVSIYYKDGKLVRAGLRPRDGQTGEDVTENIKYVEGVPAALPEPLTCVVRGEIICLISKFDANNAALMKSGEKTFANPRNYAAGSIRQFKDPTITKDRNLTFRAYSVVGLDNPPYKNEMERAKWCATHLKIPYIQVRPLGAIPKAGGKGFDVGDVYDALEAMEVAADALDYETDGVVISVSDLEDQEQLGTHGNSPSGNPKGKIAWKFTEEVAVAKVKNIELNVGRTGDITPVLIFETPVQLAGTSVGRCTGHNYGYVTSNNIGVGTVIEVIKSGEIIPKCHKVVSGQTKFFWPISCPSCGGLLQVQKGGDPSKSSLFCGNDDCGDRVVTRLCHYLTTFGVKGLSDSTVTKLHKAGLVREPADFYRLQVDDLIRLDGEDPLDPKKEFRSQCLTVARIHMVPSPDKIKNKASLRHAIVQAMSQKHRVPLWQFIASLGIIGVGKAAGRALEGHFRSLTAMRKASLAQMMQVEDIGVTTADVLCAYFEKHEAAIDRLLRYVEPTLPKAGKLTGKTFVFTGGFPEGKDHWQKLVEEQGGKCAGSVGKKTDYCVVGTDAGSKQKKAEELGVPQLTVDDLKKML